MVFKAVVKGSIERKNVAQLAQLTIGLRFDSIQQPPTRFWLRPAAPNQGFAPPLGLHVANVMLSQLSSIPTASSGFATSSTT